MQKNLLFQDVSFLNNPSDQKPEKAESSDSKKKITDQTADKQVFRSKKKKHQ